ncbi:hypothetical protein ScPMuIL_007714 [Solemya velum]
MSELPSGPWENLSMDFCGSLNIGKYLLVIVNEYSRYPVVEIVRSVSANATIPVLDKVIGMFSMPKVIKIDNGSPFNSRAFRQYAETMRFVHRIITPRWLRANAQAENFNKPLMKTIRAAHISQLNWKQEIYKFSRQYRAIPHMTTGQSPHKLMFMREPNTKLPQIPTRNVDPSLDELVRRNDSAAKYKMKQAADKKNRASEKNIKEGDRDYQGSCQPERFTVEKCLKEAYRLHRSEVKSLHQDFEELQQKYEKLQIIHERTNERARSLQEENRQLLEDVKSQNRSSGAECLLCSSLQSTLSSVDRAYKQTILEKEKVIRMLESQLREFQSLDTECQNDSFFLSVGSIKPVQGKKEQSPDSTSKTANGNSVGANANPRSKLHRLKQKRCRYIEDILPEVKKSRRESVTDIHWDASERKQSLSLNSDLQSIDGCFVTKQLDDVIQTNTNTNFCVLVPETCDPGDCTVFDEHLSSVCDTPTKVKVSNSRTKKIKIADTQIKTVPETYDVGQLSDEYDDTIAGTPVKNENTKSLVFSQAGKTAINTNNGEEDNNSVTETQSTVKECTQRKRHISSQDFLQSPESDSGDMDVTMENVISHRTLNLSGTSCIEEEDHFQENQKKTTNSDESSHLHGKMGRTKLYLDTRNRDEQCNEKKTTNGTDMNEICHTGLEIDPDVTVLSPEVLRVLPIMQLENFAGRKTSFLPFEEAKPVMTSTQMFDSCHPNSNFKSPANKGSVQTVFVCEKSPSVFTGKKPYPKNVVSTDFKGCISELSDPESPLLLRPLSDSQNRTNRTSHKKKLQKISSESVHMNKSDDIENTDVSGNILQRPSKAMSEISHNYNSQEDDVQIEQKKLSPHNKKSTTEKNLEIGNTKSKKILGAIEFEDNAAISRILKQTTLSQAFTKNPKRRNKAPLDYHYIQSQKKQDIEKAIQMSLDETHSHGFVLPLNGKEKENSPPFKKPQIPQKKKKSPKSKKIRRDSKVAKDDTDPDETIAPHSIIDLNQDSNPRTDLNGSLDPDVQLSLYCKESVDLDDVGSSSDLERVSCTVNTDKGNHSSTTNKKKQTMSEKINCVLETDIEDSDNTIFHEENLPPKTNKQSKKLKNLDSAVTLNTDVTDEVDEIKITESVELEGESQNIPSSYKFSGKKRRQRRQLDNHLEGSNCELTEDNDSKQTGKEDDLDNSFDKRPKKKDVDFAYTDVVKKQNERRKLTGHVCQECYEYYKTTGMSEEEIQERIQNCSRHRSKYIPPDTPEHFWSIGFPDTQECEERGYINVEEDTKPSRHRRKRQLQKMFKSRVEEG